MTALIALSLGSATRIVVVVDEVAEVEVGNKIGFVCDDTKILQAGMVTRGTRNYFIVKGVAAGITLCRVGADPSFPSFLFEVEVQPKPGT